MLLWVGLSGWHQARLIDCRDAVESARGEVGVEDTAGVDEAAEDGDQPEAAAVPVGVVRRGSVLVTCCRWLSITTGFSCSLPRWSRAPARLEVPKARAVWLEGGDP